MSNDETNMDSFAYEADPTPVEPTDIPQTDELPEKWAAAADDTDAPELIKVETELGTGYLDPNLKTVDLSEPESSLPEPEVVEEVEVELSPYQERVIWEQAELQTKFNALTVFIATPDSTFAALPNDEKKVLREQAACMEGYNKALKWRIHNFNA